MVVAESAQYVEPVKLFGTLGAKLLNAYTRQAETLAKLQRGGEQVIKHVDIDNLGGQAAVADHLVTGGSRKRMEVNSMDKAHASPRCLARTRRAKACRVSCDDRQEAVQAAWGLSPGAPRGNRHNLKHGRYSCETLTLKARLREVLTMACVA